MLFIILYFVLIANLPFSHFESQSENLNVAENLSNESIRLPTRTTSSIFPPNGQINGLKSYLPENSAVDRFSTISGSFDSWIRYNWKDAVGGISEYEIAYPDPPSTRYRPQWLKEHGLELSMAERKKAIL